MRRLIMLGVAGALALALAAPATSSAAAGDYFLKIQGVGETTPGGGCLDCLGTTLDASGSGACTVCIAGKPTGGIWELLTTATVTRTCKVKSVSGSLAIKWDDGSTSTVAVTGRLRGSTLKLIGTFPATDPTWPTDPTKVLLENYPPSPCVAASDEVIGAVKISTG